MTYHRMKANLAMQQIAWHGLSRLSRDGMPLTADNLSRVTDLSRPRCTGYFTSLAKLGYLIGEYPNQVIVKHPTKPCPPMPPLARPLVSKPKAEKSSTAVRRCLLCGKDRLSSGPGDRLHAECRVKVAEAASTMEGL